MQEVMFLVVHWDRHTDDEYVLCLTEEAAMREAKQRVDAAMGHYHPAPEDVDTESPAERWLYYVQLEDCFCVTVERVVVQP